MDINKTPIALRGISSNNKDIDDIHNGDTINKTKLIESLKYDGKVGDIYKIWIKNFFLNILTFGTYEFWGKIKLRQYVVGSYELAKHRFEYKGTGGELCKGFIRLSIYAVLATIAIVIPLFFLYSHLAKTTPSFSTGIKFISSVLPLLFFPFMFAAFYKSYKYKVSRISWKGIRGSLEGSLIKFSLMAFFLRHGLNILTVGIFSPFLRRMEYKYIIQNLYIGKTKFVFNDSLHRSEFYSIIFVNLFSLLFAIPSLGLSRKWYHSKMLNYLSQCTRINDISFKTTFEWLALFELKVKNLFILIFTLGLGHPIILNNNAKFFANNFFVIGDLNNLKLLQSKTNVGAAGEELINEMDLGGDIGF